MHPPLPMRGCNVTTKPCYILLFNQNARKLGAVRTALSEVASVCSGSSIAVLLRLQDSVYDSSGLRRQDGHPFNFFPLAGRVAPCGGWPTWRGERGFIARALHYKFLPSQRLLAPARAKSSFFPKKGNKCLSSFICLL